jgi:hypothetical protein
MVGERVKEGRGDGQKIVLGGRGADRLFRSDRRKRMGEMLSNAGEFFDVEHVSGIGGRWV